MSGLDITPLVPGGRQLIQGYGEGGFRIAGQFHQGSVLVFPDYTVAWPVRAAAEVTVETLPVRGAGTPPVDVLLIGCGASFQQAPAGLRVALKESGMVLEWMDTGAACRTFNVLLAEERRTAAALIAVD